MTNSQTSLEQMFYPSPSSVLQLLDAYTQIQFQLPSAGVSFRPGILQILEANTQIQFRVARVDKEQSVSVVESLTKPVVMPDRQLVYC